MSLVKYAAFQSVAELGSFSAAAQEVHCTQSAVSRMIKDLEDAWGVTLFTRMKSGTVLTEEGSRLLPYVREVLRSDASLRGAVNAITGLATGHVRIGAFASVATFWLPRVIRAFKRSFPSISYEVLMGDFEEIEDWVRTGRVDFGFSTERPGAGVQAAVAARDELLLVVAADHRLAQLAAVPLSELGGEPFLLLEKGRPGNVSHLLRDAGVQPDVQLKTFEDHAIISMAEMGLGVGILPRLIIRGEYEGVCFKPLQPAAHREILLMLKEGSFATLAAREFLSCMARELAADLQPAFGRDLARLMPPAARRR
ncbi:MAG: LysR family transcriptional regulator [Duodenibacillus sp.]|nr:LysR family transcriptional regulator [Duodenibacillus sp.]